ncbi:MAG: hypothetical protein IKV44_02745 [Clostridia bacterium]|nr:hypothetical protein [Clostridia bacterium]
MSRINQTVFSAACSGTDYNKHTVTFYGCRYELLQRLADDFVAPIERNEIYNLTYSLYNQLCRLTVLGDVSDGSIELTQEHLSAFVDLFSVQGDLLFSFSQKSEYASSIKLCRQAQQQLLSLKRSILTHMLNGLSHSKQPLYKCVVMNCVVDACDSINDTLSVCERCFINNI